MNGLDFFISKSNNDDFDINKIEHISNLSLLPYYSLFASCFKLGRYVLKIDKFLETKFENIVACSSVKIENDNISGEYFFSGFFSFEELKNDWESYSSNSHEYLEYGFIRIGSIGIGGGIFIGTKGDSKDKIFLVNWGLDEDYIFLSNNIFEFAKSLVFMPYDINFDKGITFSNLYKNWGEDFWRLKL